MSDECVIDADFSDDSTEEIGLKDNKNGDKFSGSEGYIETTFEDDKFSECFLNEVSYATSGTRNRKDLQSVFVKDEVKNENSDSDIQMSDDCVMDPDFSDDSGEEMGLKEKKNSDKFRGSKGDNETAFKDNKIQNMSDTGGIPLNVNIEDNATLDLQFDCLKVEIDNGRSRDEAGSGIDPGTAVHDHPSAKVPGTLKRKTKRCPAKKTKKAKGVKGNGVNKKVKGSEDKLYTTIELTHEQMLDERNAAHGSESFQSSAYKCETCILGFQYRRPYEAHLSSRHAKTLGDYVCPICKTVVMSVDSFTAHYRRHMRRFQCNLCEKRTIDRGRIKQHLYTEHGVVMSTIKCKQCGHVSRSLDNHIHHLDTHKGRFKCKECTKTFKHRGGLKNHAIAVHELKNNFPCSVCQKVFRWKNSLKRHTEVHLAKDTTEAAYCESCGIGFKSVCSFQRHMKNSLKHVTHDQRKYVCDHCNRRFIDKTKLRDHIECKHMHKTYQCHICLKPSKNRVNLDQHIRNVHKGRPNNKICHHCGKGFPTKVQLDSHMRTHTGERPFICEYCPTTFTQKSNLYKHYKQVHLNIKSKRYPPVKKPKDALNCQPSIGGFERINGTTYPPERGLVPC